MPHQIKEKFVSMRMEPDLVAALKSVSKQEGVSYGKFVRDLVKSELRSRGAYTDPEIEYATQK